MVRGVASLETGQRRRSRATAGLFSLFFFGVIIGCVIAPRVRTQDTEECTITENVAAVRELLPLRRSSDAGVLNAHLFNLMRRSRAAIESLRLVADSDHPSKDHARRMIEALERSLRQE